MIDRLSALGQKRLIRNAYYGALVCVLFLALLPQSSGQGIPHADKFMHFLIFLLITVAGRLTHRGVSIARLAAALLAYGMIIELLQGMTSWRTASGGDLLADGIGVAAGLAIGRFAARLDASV